VGTLWPWLQMAQRALELAPQPPKGGIIRYILLACSESYFQNRLFIKTPPLGS
jgi:hypothetical protein